MMSSIDFSLRLLSRNRLSVFLFHAVPKLSPEIPQDFTLGQFEEMLHFIRRRFTVIPLDEAVKAMKGGKLPERCACLTFDDGYTSWTTGVAPLLREAGLHATFYITTGQFAGLPMWHERVARAITAFKGNTLAIPGFGLPPLLMGGLAQRRHTFSLVEQFLKYQTVEDRESLLLMLERRAGVTLSALPCMSEQQLKDLASMGFGIGAHTHSHPILTLCDRQQAVAEVGSVRESLAGLLRCNIDSFAYPNGRPLADFNSEHVDIVKAAGYQHAVTTDWGAATPKTSPFEIPRFTPWGPTPKRMALQIVRNLLTLPREVESTRPKRPPKILVVENGAGFGGAVIALKSLLGSVDATQASFHVVSNMPVPGLSELPAVKGVKVLRDRSFDSRKLARRLQTARPVCMRPILQFAAGRLDDLFNRLPYFAKLGWYVGRLRPDIVHGNNEPNSNREAMLLARLLRIPFVQHVRGPLAPTRMAPWLLTSPAAFVPVSRWLAGDLLVRGVQGHRIRQVYDGVDMTANGEGPPRNLRADLGLPPATLLVGMVGMLVQWKGQGLFIDAVDKIANTELDMAFLLFGDTPEHGDKAYAQRLRDQVESLGLQSLVHFMGRQSGLTRLLPQLDIVVSASTEPEPLGLVMIEAMASGCSFVAPAFGAATEVVEDGVTGFLFQPRDSVDLAQVLLRAAASRREGGEMPTLARQRVVDRFSPQQCSEQTLRVYQTAPLR